MLQGTVKWFNGKKGYGFIIEDSTDKEYFVHYSSIISEKSYRTLEDGQKVHFDTDNTAAINVQVIA